MPYSYRLNWSVLEQTDRLSKAPTTMNKGLAYTCIDTHTYLFICVCIIPTIKFVIQ